MIENESEFIDKGVEEDSVLVEPKGEGADEESMKRVVV